MELSIIIPAYNEGKKILKDIVAADSFIASNNFSGEIIIVDDGSNDDTVEIANSLKEKVNSLLKIISLNSNVGKGGAIQEGVKNSKGEIVMYADAGLTVPFENSLVGIDLIKNDKCNIANGSRKLKKSVIVKKQEFDRRVISKVFGFLFKSILKIPKEMTDTQCGFKVYDGSVARELFPKLITTGFLFEVELILLAVKGGHKIIEFPVTWKCDSDSRLSVSKSSKKIIKDFIQLSQNYSNK
jgi:dolichyl-phosphate beta-glucosyltransferase